MEQQEYYKVTFLQKLMEGLKECPQEADSNTEEAVSQTPVVFMCL